MPKKTKSKKPVTDLVRFLDWCSSRCLSPERHPQSSTIWRLPASAVKINFGGVELTPTILDNFLTFYFQEDGSWNGGTNWIWSDKFPWIHA